MRLLGEVERLTTTYKYALSGTACAVDSVFLNYTKHVLKASIGK